MERLTARLCAVLACAAGVGAGVAVACPAPALAAQGARVRFTQLPQQFNAGADPVTMTVVASKGTAGDCLKVRWSMVIRVAGMDLSQVAVDRIEEDGAFPVSVQVDGNAVRLTDVRLDPGQLCPDRTVTARYRFRFDEQVTDGRVTFDAEAFDANQRLLERASATRTVLAAGAVVEPTTPAAPPEQTADPAPTDDAAVPPADATTEPAPDDNAPPPAGDAPPPPAAAASSTGIGIPPIGFLVGAMMVFLGVTLLFRLRKQLRRTPVAAPAWGGQRGREYINRR